MYAKSFRDAICTLILHVSARCAATHCTRHSCVEVAVETAKTLKNKWVKSGLIKRGVYSSARRNYNASNENRRSTKNNDDNHWSHSGSLTKQQHEYLGTQLNKVGRPCATQCATAATDVRSSSYQRLSYHLKLLLTDAHSGQKLSLLTNEASLPRGMHWINEVSITSWLDRFYIPTLIGLAKQTTTCMWKVLTRVKICSAVSVWQFTFNVHPWLYAYWETAGTENTCSLKHRRI